MKFNKIISAVILTGFCLSLHAAQTSFVVLPSVMTNAPTLLAGPAKVTQFTLTSTSTNIATVKVYDTPTNSTTFTVGPYSNIVSYVTNYITTWTNYYGATNSLTNLALIDITNSTAQVTNAYNVELVATAPTNSTVIYNNLGAVFQYGIWVTNVGAGSAIITINYNQ